MAAGANVSKLSRELGVSRKGLYQWQKQFRTGGASAPHYGYRRTGVLLRREGWCRLAVNHGFWLGRVLSKEDWIESHIVEAASIAMSRIDFVKF